MTTAKVPGNRHSALAGLALRPSDRIMVRLATADEEDAFVELARAYADQRQPSLLFNEAIARETFRSYMRTAFPTIFFAGDGSGIAGCFVATIGGDFIAERLFTTLVAIYVVRDARRQEALAALLEAFVDWSKVVGASEMFIARDYDQSPGAMDPARRLGFKPAGVVLSRQET